MGWRAAAALMLGLLFSGTVDARAATPQLILTPSQGTPAQVIQASGTGFCPTAPPACGTVTITFQNYGDVVRNIQVSSAGSFTAQFQPPAGPPGMRSVTATQDLGNGKQNIAVTTFTLTLQPSGASPPPQTKPTPTPSRSPAPAPSAAPAPTATPTLAASGSPSPTLPPAAGPRDGGAAPRATGAGLPWPGIGIAILLLLAVAALGALAWRLRRRVRAPA